MFYVITIKTIGYSWTPIAADLYNALSCLVRMFEVGESKDFPLQLAV